MDAAFEAIVAEHQTAVRALFIKESAAVGRFLGERMAGRRLLYVSPNGPDERRKSSIALRVAHADNDALIDAVNRRWAEIPASIASVKSEPDPHLIDRETRKQQVKTSPQEGPSKPRSMLTWADFALPVSPVLLPQEAIVNPARGTAAVVADAAVVQRHRSQAESPISKDDELRFAIEASQYRHSERDWQSTRHVPAQVAAEAEARAAMKFASEKNEVRRRVAEEQRRIELEIEASTLSYADRLLLNIAGNV